MSGIRLPACRIENDRLEAYPTASEVGNIAHEVLANRALPRC